MIVPVFKLELAPCCKVVSSQELEGDIKGSCVA